MARSGESASAMPASWHFAATMRWPCSTRSATPMPRANITSPTSSRSPAAAGRSVRPSRPKPARCSASTHREKLAQVEALWQGGAAAAGDALRRYASGSGKRLLQSRHGDGTRRLRRAAGGLRPGRHESRPARPSMPSAIWRVPCRPRRPVGPFARLRPGADLAQDAKVGNFCEVKNAAVSASAPRSTISPISATPRRRGGRTSAPAPSPAITTARSSTGPRSAPAPSSAPTPRWSRRCASATAPMSDTGSVITEDVPDGALAIARERQVTKPGRGRQIVERNAAAKAAKAAGKA